MDLAEYVAQFWNSKAVQQVRRERVARRESDEPHSREVYEAQLKELFGQEIDFSSRKLSQH